MAGPERRRCVPCQDVHGVAGFYRDGSCKRQRRDAAKRRYQRLVAQAALGRFLIALLAIHAHHEGGPASADTLPGPADP